MYQDVQLPTYEEGSERVSDKTKRPLDDETTNQSEKRKDDDGPVKLGTEKGKLNPEVTKFLKKKLDQLNYFRDVRYENA